MNKLTRRELIKASALCIGAFSISFGLSGCLELGSSGDFLHGVASGDPLSDSVILWTRVTPNNNLPVAVLWEVALDATFTNLIHNGQMSASAEHDHTIKVDVRNLLPGTRYYYRFRTGTSTSPVGITRTLPAQPERVALAVISCMNYPAGYFHACTEIAANIADSRDLDAVVFLGDYIYEYGMGEYATEDAVALGRTLAPDNASETLTLTDYRRRYALYRTDGGLQALHARLPWIVVWDDHEIADDAWKNGAYNHDEASEGDYDERKSGALQAYFEWLPIRPVIENDDSTIYRSFRFGDLVALQMLDTRVIGRSRQLTYADYMDSAGNIDIPRFYRDLDDPTRELLGDDQFRWLQGAVAESAGVRWQVLGQQVLMARQHLPADLVKLLQRIYTEQDEPEPAPAQLEATLDKYAQLKQQEQRMGPSLMSEDTQSFGALLPLNLDAWDGYPVARERVLSLFKEAGSNLVVLAGDTHNAWSSVLTMEDGSAVGVEFAVQAVSSPGLESFLDDPASADLLTPALTMLVKDLRYVNLRRRGFMIVEFNNDQARAEWFFIDTVKKHDYRVLPGPAWRARPGRPGPELVWQLPPLGKL